MRMKNDTTIAIQTNGLTKTYDKGKVLAVDNISLEIKEGELFGLIGPDGAGKTSMFRMLTTLLLPDKGSATVDGFDIVRDYRQIRNRIGYMPGRFSLYQDLTVRENLEFFATLFNTTIRENYHLIKDIYEHIEPFSNRRAGKLSGGMKQKLALSCALIHKPSVLFLDEPTTGVDAVSRREFWDILSNLKSQGITIMVSTPYMDEALLCERIALIQEGRIMSVNTPANIINEYPGKLYALKSENIYRLLKDIRKHEAVESSYPFGEFLHVTLKKESAEIMDQVKNYAREKGHQQFEMKPIDPTIEDSFIRLMQEVH